LAVETEPLNQNVCSASFQPMEVDAVSSSAGISESANSVSVTCPVATVLSPFSDFKFPAETKGQDLYHNELSDVSRDEFKPCDRETVVYCLDDIEPEVIQATAEEIPDEFFEVTEADIRRMWQDMQRRTQEILEQPLLTLSSRQRQLEAKMARYKRVAIRLQFPDRLVVQALFRPTETVFSLYKFVRDNLIDRSIPFELYTTPPKTVLKDNTQTIAEADLAPMSLVYFGSSVKREHYLSADLLSKVESQQTANIVLLKLNQDHLSSRPVSATLTTTTTTTVPSAQIPKWFKIGNK
jgi:tether containing UBX domain for GLUT4